MVGGMSDDADNLAAGDPAHALAEFVAHLAGRRSCRRFSDRPVPRAVIEQVVAAATTAPSGANKQPWRFVAVSSPTTKRRVREAAEAEEREFYGRRASRRWLDDLRPLGTDADKPYLETAPWLIAVFKQVKAADGSQVYYPDESVGIACGMLLAAARVAGLATLTHTPSPMRFLAEVLGRPANERAYLLIPIGHAADGWSPPDHASLRLPPGEVLTFDE